MRAAVYCRVSSRAQKERDTIASQRKRLPAFVKREGWELVETYIDDGKSAKSGQLDKRDGFAKLLRDVAAGKFDVVVVVDLDRLTRSDDWTERGAILGTFQTAGVKIAIESSGQLLDLSSSQGDLFAGLQAFFASEENRKRSERTRRGQERVRKAGRLSSGKPPFWLRFDKTSPTPWSLDKDAAKKIRRYIIEPVIAGSGGRAIAERLNSLGVLPRPNGGEWGQSKVHQLMRNPALYGDIVVKRNPVQTISVPEVAIIDRATWERAQRAMSSRRTVEDSRARHFNLCEGLMRCGTCGARVAITQAGQGKRYYLCVNKKKGKGASRCPNPGQRIEKVDDRVWSAMVTRLRDPDLLSQAAARRSQRADSSDWQADIEDWTRKLASLEKRHGAILARYQRGQIDDALLDSALADYSRTKGFLESNLATARQAVKASKRSKAETRALTQLVSQLAERLESASQAERQAALRLLFAGDETSYIRLGPGQELEMMGRLSVVQSSHDRGNRDSLDYGSPLPFRVQA